jgi:hypothetical protein
MIFNLRGTHGSGKSTVALKLLKQFPHELVNPNPKGKPEGYVLQVTRKRLLFIVGPYLTACGGCDAIQPYDLIWPRVEAYARQGDVFFEGALVSSSVGNIGRAMAQRKDCVVGFINTPLQTCLARIQKRREKKGDLRPLNPLNTTVKYEGIQRSRPQLEALGLRCVTINHHRALREVGAQLGIDPWLV